jgi:hypothetical protein
MGRLAALLEGHVRHEERVLFPLIERLVGDPALASSGLGKAQPDRLPSRDDPAIGRGRG